MIIGGQKVSASNGQVMDVVNPSTQEVVDTVPVATRQDIDTALDCAVAGFKEWSDVSLNDRIQVMRKFLQLYDAHTGELVDYVVKEAGKTIRSARGEAAYTRGFIEQYTDLARFIGSETFPMGSRAAFVDDLMLTVREPLGVVIGILPFNFPLSQVPHKTIAPLLMGNSVIMKPSSETPLTQIRLVELLLEAGVPGNAIQIVTGRGSEIGPWLTSDPRASKVSLTGSTEVGVDIAKEAAKNLHHVKLELGGNDPLIILEDADLDYAVSESIAGRGLGNAGQVCCSNKRFIVHNRIKEAYEKKLVEALRGKRVGNAAEEASDCGPMISIRSAQEVEQHIKDAVAGGAKLLLGGNRDQAYFDITVLEITRDMEIAKDLELFAPVFPVIGFDTVEEAIEIANNTQYGLSSGVIGKDSDVMFRVARHMQAGCCVINGTGDHRRYDQPFGGYKMSGLGREGLRFTLEDCTQLKTLVIHDMYKK